jgi:protein involved in polysaccharide export with SLBB domain
MKTMLRLILGLRLGVASLPAQDSPAPVTDAPAPVASMDSAYLLRPADKLLFAIAEDPIPGAQPDEVIVNALGHASFRISRASEAAVTLDVRGKTLAQVRDELGQRLRADYYHRASIDLRLKEASPQMGKVLFSGAVRNNVLPLPPGEPKTLFEGILQVGVNEFAHLRRVRLSRLDPQTGREVVQIIDVEAIRKDRSKDIPLQDGDRVDVPEKSLVF